MFFSSLFKVAADGQQAPVTLPDIDAADPGVALGYKSPAEGLTIPDPRRPTNADAMSILNDRNVAADWNLPAIDYRLKHFPRFEEALFGRPANGRPRYLQPWLAAPWMALSDMSTSAYNKWFPNLRGPEAAVGNLAATFGAPALMLGAGNAALPSRLRPLVGSQLRLYTQALNSTQVAADAIERIRWGYNNPTYAHEATASLTPEESVNYNPDRPEERPIAAGPPNPLLHNTIQRAIAYWLQLGRRSIIPVGTMSGPPPVEGLGGLWYQYTKPMPLKSKYEADVLRERVRYATNKNYFPAVNSAEAIPGIDSPYRRLRGTSPHPSKPMLSTYQDVLESMMMSGRPHSTYDYQHASRALTGEADPVRGSYVYDTLYNIMTPRNYALSLRIRKRLRLPENAGWLRKALSSVVGNTKSDLSMDDSNRVYEQASAEYLVAQNIAQLNMLVRELNITPFEAALILNSGMNISLERRQGRALDPRNRVGARLELEELVRAFDKARSNFTGFFGE